MNKLTQVVNEAQRRLSKSAYDVVHGFSHHQDVWQKAQLILKSAKNVADPEVVEIACWWHDVKDPGVVGTAASASAVMAVMKQAGYEQDIIQAVHEAINSHEYTDHPTTDEGKILWDADKLTILNSERWQEMADADKRNQVTHEYAQQAFATVWRWVPELKSKVHFPISQILAEKYLQELKDDPRVRQIASMYGHSLDYLKL